MRHRQPLPTLWLMTDERVPEARLLRAVARLPRRSGVVFRHYSLGDDERHALFKRLRRIATRRDIILLSAGRAEVAKAWGADGVHGDGARHRCDMMLSLAVHDMAELRAAERARADIVFVSPLFATRSHPGKAGLGAGRFAAIARRATMPVMAMGGVAPRHARLIRMLGAKGFGAIDSLSR